MESRGPESRENAWVSEWTCKGSEGRGLTEPRTGTLAEVKWHKRDKMSRGREKPRQQLWTLPTFSLLLSAARVWQRGQEGHWLWTAPRSHILTSSLLLPGLTRAATTQQASHCHPYHCGYTPQMRLTEKNFQILQSDPQRHLDHKEGKGSKTSQGGKPTKALSSGAMSRTHCRSLISWLNPPWPYRHGNGQGHCEATYSFVSSFSLILNFFILLCHLLLYKQP